jgi:RNA polymerase sigma factor (sigma-70 family)
MPRARKNPSQVEAKLSSDKHLEDAPLAHRADSDDVEARAVLLERYRGRMREGAIRIIRDRDAADGVVSRFTLRFLQRGWGTAGAPEDVPAFFCKAIRHLAFDVLREQRRRAERERGWGIRLHRTHRSPLLDSMDAEVRDKLHAAMARLSPRQREAFELVRLEGHPFGAVAERMRTTTKRAEKLDTAARARLREELEHLYRDDLWDDRSRGGGGLLRRGGV